MAAQGRLAFDDDDDDVPMISAAMPVPRCPCRCRALEQSQLHDRRAMRKARAAAARAIEDDEAEEEEEAPPQKSATKRKAPSSRRTQGPSAPVAKRGKGKTGSNSVAEDAQEQEQQQQQPLSPEEGQGDAPRESSSKQPTATMAAPASLSSSPPMPMTTPTQPALSAYMRALWSTLSRAPPVTGGAAAVGKLVKQPPPPFPEADAGTTASQSSDAAAAASAAGGRSRGTCTTPKMSASAVRAAFLSTRLPLRVSSLTIEYESTRHTRLGVQVVYRSSSSAAVAGGRALVAREYRPIEDSDATVQLAAADPHGFVRLETLWPYANTNGQEEEEGGFEVSMEELIDVMSVYYNSPLTRVERRFLQVAVEAGTLARGDPYVTELQLAPQLAAVGDAPGWPQPRFSWTDQYVTRALEMMQLETGGSAPIEKVWRIFEEGAEDGGDRDFDATVATRVVVETRTSSGVQLPMALLSTDWVDSEVCELARQLWLAHPLLDDPDRPALLRKPWLSGVLAYMAPNFSGNRAILIVWAYQRFRHTIADSGDSGDRRAAEVAKKIDDVLESVHQQRKAATAAAAADQSDPTQAPRYLLLGGRQRIALLDVTTVTPAAAAAASTSSSLVDLKLDMELE